MALLPNVLILCTQDDMTCDDKLSKNGFLEMFSADGSEPIGKVFFLIEKL